MVIALIVAHDRDRGIGKDNRMPWHLPGELAYFKRTTLGKPVIMGRHTHQSIGRALPGRRNLVVSSQAVTTPGVEQVPSLEAALERCAGEAECMIIGGGQLYRAALPRAHRIYATEIDARFPADTHFPELGTGWREVSRLHQPADERNAHALDYVVYERIGG